MHQLPYVARVVSDAERLSDNDGNPTTGPNVSSESVRLRATLKKLGDRLQLRF